MQQFVELRVVKSVTDAVFAKVLVAAAEVTLIPIAPSAFGVPKGREAGDTPCKKRLLASVALRQPTAESAVASGFAVAQG